MKAQFKYAFKTGYRIRGNIFLVILVFNLISVSLGVLGLLPVAALITAVSLSGIAVAVMAVTNIISDIRIFREMLASPRAYLHALTPSPRYKTVIANLLVVTIFDIVTMAVTITGVTWSSLLLAGNFFDIAGFIRSFGSLGLLNIVYGFGCVLTTVAGYLLLIMFIVSCIVVKKSIFYQKRAGGLLTFLVAIAALYVHSLSLFLLAPFGAVSGYFGFYSITIGRGGTIAYGILLLIQTAALVIITSRLMERKLNI